MIFAEHFLKEANSELNRSVTDISDEVIECLMTYNWPGNIRELKNVIRRATLLSEENQIQLKALPLEISTLAKTSAIENVFGANIAVNSNKHSIKNAAIEAEYKTIINVLKEVNFNKTKAAKILKIDRKTLYNKMKLTNPEN
jgi:two-component system response regulator HydG